MPLDEAYLERHGGVEVVAKQPRKATGQKRAVHAVGVLEIGTTEVSTGITLPVID
jgi:hypothetical protein